MSKPIRGRFYAVKSMPTKGRRGSRMRGWWQWHAEIWQGRTMLWSDDCRDPQKLIPNFTRTLAAFIRLSEIGQKFDPWRDIVERADRL